VEWIDINQKTIKYFVSISQKPIEPIPSRRGFKQGDHLSSYIFILALIVFFVLEI
jgi:hypothetical protein